MKHTIVEIACIGKLLVNHNLFLKNSEWVRARKEGTNSLAIGFKRLISLFRSTSLVLWINSFVRTEELDLGVRSSGHNGFVSANEVVLLSKFWSSEESTFTPTFSATAMVKPKDRWIFRMVIRLSETTLELKKRLKILGVD